MSNYLDEAYEDQLVPKYESLEQVMPKLAPDKPEPAPTGQQSSFNSRKKQAYSMADTVLLNWMDPNRPDIAQAAGNPVEISPSPPRRGERSESDEKDTNPQENIEENLDDVIFAQQEEAARKKKLDDAINLSLFPTLTNGTSTNSPELNEIKTVKPAEGQKSDSMEDIVPLIPPKTKPRGLPDLDLKMINDDGFVKPTGKFSREPPQTARFARPEIGLQKRKPSLPDSFSPSYQDTPSPAALQNDTILTSSVGQHAISPPTPAHNLPAIQNSTTASSPKSATSTHGSQRLPGIGPILEIADAQVTRQRGSSFGQMGPSPTFSGGAPSPSPFQFASSHASPTEPMSAGSPTNYPHSFNGPPPLTIYRRTSVTTSDHPYANALNSASTASEAYTSPDQTFSPAETQNTSVTTPSDRGLRIVPGPYPGGPPHTPLHPSSAGTSPQSGVPPYNTSPIINGHIPNGTLTSHGPKLPLPNQPPSQHPSDPASAGQYKCHHPGCKAAPFQTQYLLNSHTTVHSSDRPHYCLVPGCPRGPGGQGFKRKNEMKRHGLVHESPGYICPFCPEREHKYPRPDNLQRHVRVHHADVSMSDLRLRDVLENKGMPGGRGGSARRRPRGGSVGRGAGGMVGVEG
jgi:hypothetical protein